MLLPSLVCAQISKGYYTMFPDDKFVGSYYKPQYAYAKVGDTECISLRSCSPNAFHKFDGNSRMLLRFDDGMMFTLPIIMQDNSPLVLENYENTHSTNYNTFTNFYVTHSCFKSDADFIQKIKDFKSYIIKIRVVYAGENVIDYDITKKNQKKITGGFRRSMIVTNTLGYEEKTPNDEDF